MAALDPITALEYNNIRQSIAQQVGNFTVWGEHSITLSNTTSGYGRNFSSGLVTANVDKVTEQQMFDLYLDLQSAHVHIFNSINSAIATTEFEGKRTYPSDADIANRDTIEYQHITDLTTIATAISGFDYATTDFNQNSFDTEVLKLSDGVTSTVETRSTNWGGNGQTQAISHTLRVDFGTHNNFLYYLSAGGEVRFDASLTGGTSATANTKDWDWARILNAMGTIRINRRGGNWVTESYTGTGTGSTVATLSTGTNPTTKIFEKQGGGVTGGNPGSVPVTQIYDDNFYRIYASTNTAFSTATQLIFKIEFDDGDIGTGGQSESYLPGRIDESVTGTVTSRVYTHTPNSSFTADSQSYNAIVRPVPFGVVDTNL